MSREARQELQFLALACVRSPATTPVPAPHAFARQPNSPPHAGTSSVPCVVLVPHPPPDPNTPTATPAHPLTPHTLPLVLRVPQPPARPPPAKCDSVEGYSATPDVAAANITEVGYNCFSVPNTTNVDVPVGACEYDTKCAGFQVATLSNGDLTGCLLSQILVARADVDFALCVYAKLVNAGGGGGGG